MADFLILIASFALVTLTCPLLDWRGLNQVPAAQNEAQHKISINSDLVVLPLTVKDRNGNLVAGLELSDFRVFDDELEQPVDVLTSEAFPLSLVLLNCDDLKTKDAEQVASSLRAIAGGVSWADEAMVCRFDLLFYSGDVQGAFSVLATTLPRGIVCPSDCLSNGDKISDDE